MHRNDEAHSLRQLPDKGYILAGETGRGYAMVVRTDSTGEEIWKEYYSRDDGYPDIEDCVIDGDGNLLGLGWNNVLMKIDSEGEIIWTQDYSEYGGRVGSIENTNDGGFILSGNTFDGDDVSQNMYLMKVDSTGEFEWDGVYGAGYSENCSEVIQTSDGGYCRVGTARFGFMDSLYAMIIRTDAEGEIVWDVVFDEVRRGDRFTDVVETEDGGFAAAGFGPGEDGGDDYYLLRVNADGELLWRVYYDTIGINSCYSLLLMEDGGYLLGGDASLSSWLVRTESDPVNAIWDVDPSLPSAFQVYSAYPNPFNSATTIIYQLPVSNEVSVSILDVNGREIMKLVDYWHEAGQHSVSWNGIYTPSGLYFARIEADDKVEMIKMSLVR